MCKWKINFAALGRKVCRKRPLFVPKMGVSQLKSEEEVCRDSENGRKTLPCFGSGSGDLHAHRGQGFVPQNLDSTCCKSPFGLPSGTTYIQKQKVVTRRLHEIGRRNLPQRQILSSICTDAVKRALPHATQVADRYHLIQNLREHLQRFFDRKRTCLPEIEDIPLKAGSTSGSGSGGPLNAQTGTVTRSVSAGRS